MVLASSQVAMPVTLEAEIFRIHVVAILTKNNDILLLVLIKSHVGKKRLGVLQVLPPPNFKQTQIFEVKIVVLPPVMI